MVRPKNNKRKWEDNLRKARDEVPKTKEDVVGERASSRLSSVSNSPSTSTELLSDSPSTDQRQSARPVINPQYELAKIKREMKILKNENDRLRRQNHSLRMHYNKVKIQVEFLKLKASDNNEEFEDQVKNENVKRVEGKDENESEEDDDDGSEPENEDEYESDEDEDGIESKDEVERESEEEEDGIESEEDEDGIESEEDEDGIESQDKDESEDGKKVEDKNESESEVVKFENESNISTPKEKNQSPKVSGQSPSTPKLPKIVILSPHTPSNLTPTKDTLITPPQNRIMPSPSLISLMSVKTPQKSTGEIIRMVDVSRAKKFFKQMDVPTALKFIHTYDLTYKQIDACHRVGMFPSLSTITRAEKKIMEKENGATFYDKVIKRLEQLENNEIKSHKIRITICGDKGSTTTKVGFYLNDVDKPLSTSNFVLLYIYVGEEKRELLADIMRHIDKGIEKLLNGVKVKGILYEFEFFFVGDIKFEAMVFGMQNMSSLYPCLWCIMPRSSWAELTKDDISLRTMEDLISRGQIIENAINKKVSTSKLSKLKQENYSIMGIPLLRNIRLSNLVPPVVHILLSAVNTIIFDYVNKKKGNDNPLFEAILKLGVRVYHPGNTFAGNETRKILNFIRNDGGNLDAFGVDLLQAVAKIEPFAVARDLTEEEIDQLEVQINSFFQLIKDHHPTFPNERVKLHSLQFHVVPFVRLHKSWGKFSEQSIESFHHISNNLEKRITGNSSKTEAKRLKFVQKKQLFVNRYRA